MFQGLIVAAALLGQADKKPDVKPQLDPGLMQIVATAETQRRQKIDALKKKKAAKAAIAKAESGYYFPVPAFPYEAGNLIYAYFIPHVTVDSVVDGTQFVGRIAHFREQGIAVTGSGDNMRFKNRPAIKEEQFAWFSGCETSKLTDGKQFEATSSAEYFYVVGTKKYDAVDGSSKTVIQLRPIDLAPYLAEARKNDPPAEEKPAKKTATKPDETDAEKSERAEKSADGKLKIAEQFLKQGRRETYRSTLKEIVEKYPDTKAAEKARKALK